MQHHRGACAAHRPELDVGELVGRLRGADRRAVGIADPFAADHAAPAVAIVTSLHVGQESVAVERSLGQQDDVRGVVVGDFGHRTCRREPAGRPAHRLKNHVLIDPPHVAGQHAGLPHREGNVPSGAAEARRVVGAAQVVIDRLGHAHADQLIAVLTAVLLHAMNRVHRVVATDEKEVADVVLLQDFEDAGEVGVRKLVAAASQGGTGRVAETRDYRRRLAAKVDHIALDEPFDAEPHPKRLSDGFMREAFLDDSAEAGVDNARGSAALSDDGVAVQHESVPGVLVPTLRVGT